MYYPVEGFARQTLLWLSDVAWTTWPIFSPLYMTALLTADKYLGQTVDLFENVKIPDISRLSGYSFQSDDSFWHEVNRDKSIEYTSALGVPVAGLPQSGNSSFNLVSHYWAVSCEPFELNREFKNVTWDRIPTFDMIETVGPPANVTRFRYHTRYVTAENISLSRTSFEGRESKAACSTHPVLVESRVKCQGRSCEVVGMRRLQRKPDDILGNYEPASVWFGLIRTRMPGADLGMLQDNNTSSELVEHWMHNTDLSSFQWDVRKPIFFGESDVRKRWVDLTELPTETFAHRLQMAINTFWDASIGSTVRMGNLTKAQVAQFEDSDLKFTWNTTSLHGSRQEGSQYVCRIWFAISTIVISFLLFLAGVASLVLGLLTKAPDTLGFVSTSARDNPHFTTKVASHLDGLEAARALRDVRIRIGDVQTQREVGHVAFASLEAGPERVSRKRLYD